MLFAGVVTLVILARVLRRSNRRGARWFALSLSGVTLWVFGEAFATVATSKFFTVVWAKLTLVGAGVAGGALLFFTLIYTGREHLVTARWVTVVSTPPAVMITLAITRLRPGLMFASLEMDAEYGRLLIAASGPGMYVHETYMSLLLALTTVMLLQLVYRARNLYRWQAAAVVGAVALPWAGTVVNTVRPSPFSLSEPAFTVSAVALYVGLFRYDLIAVPPVASSRVLETLSEGVLVVNGRGLLADLNPATERLLDVEEAAVVGRPVEAALDDHPALLAVLHDEREGPVELEADDEHRSVTVERAPLGERRGGSVYLLNDVTERLRRERELKRQNDRLDQFASIVSHDVRNPLTVADGYAATLEPRLDGEERELLGEIRTSHDRIESIVEDVLTLARQGDAELDERRVDLEAVAGEAWSQVDTADATLSVDGDEPISADPDRLQRALENCFRNSVEHGGEDVSVTIEPLADGFAVADDGPGIPAEERDEVLDPGYSTSASGNGFGLAIVGGVAEAHGWDLSVAESAAGGARFEFRGVAASPATDDASG